MQDSPLRPHGEASVTLHVETGPQAARTIPCPSGRTSIGTGFDGDIVLFEPSGESWQFAVIVGADIRLHSIAGRAAILRDDGDEPMADTRVDAPQTVFRAGSVMFRLRCDLAPATPAAPAAATRRGFGSARRLALAGIIAFLIAMGLGYMAVPLKPVPGAHAASNAPAPAPPDGDFAAARRRAVALLRARLASDHLDHVRVILGNDGALRADGQIGSHEAALWRGARRWFSQRFDSRFVLVDRVGVASSAPPLTIQSVWTGPAPYVIDQFGKKLFIGAVLRDGWTIAAIAQDQVLLRRDGKTLAERF